MNTAVPLLDPALLAAACPGLWTTRPVSVSVQPNGSAVVRHSVPPADGTARTLVAATGTLPAEAMVLESDGLRVALWAWPHDPHLPGLARAGEVVGRPARVRGYRPGRRAVLEAGDVFVRVVRPSAVAASVERHEALAARLPAPPVLRATDDGVVVLPAMPGAPWRPGPAGYAQLTALLEALPAVDRPVRGHLDRVGDFAAILRLTVPEVSAAVDGLVALLPEPEVHERVPVHGDLHPGQVPPDTTRAGSGPLVPEPARAVPPSCRLLPSADGGPSTAPQRRRMVCGQPASATCSRGTGRSAR